ncbi:MAG: phosphohydrolase [Desulfobulbaceae bacterium]|nr:MAG: phosphohydrolase [Desulfobulbaceae bacterium]
MSRVDEVLMMVKHVPPYPKVAQRVMELLEDPNTTAAQLAEVIHYDSAITANVLKICNAAYFGLPRKVSSLDEALVVVGQDILKDIISTSCSAKFYKGTVGAGYDLGQGELWKHSVASGIMAKMLIRFFPDVNPSSAFTTALLHDIGKRFMSGFIAEEQELVVAMVEKEQCSFVEAEQKIVGIDHARLGGMILGNWEFPEEMREAVERHHDADALDQGGLVALVALANVLVVSMGIGVGVDGLATPVHGEMLGRFGITEMDVQLLMADLLDEMARAEELLNM